jgi:hypothetical protein
MSKRKDKPKGRKPEWVLKTFDKQTEETGAVGVGWDNANGSISIRLNSHVQLRQDMNEVLHLFPAEFTGKVREKEEESNEEIPF